MHTLTHVGKSRKLKVKSQVIIRQWGRSFLIPTHVCVIACRRLWVSGDPEAGGQRQHPPAWAQHRLDRPWWLSPGEPQRRGTKRRTVFSQLTWRGRSLIGLHLLVLKLQDIQVMVLNSIRLGQTKTKKLSSTNQINCSFLCFFLFSWSPTGRRPSRWTCSNHRLESSM